MTDPFDLADRNLIEGYEASNVAAINGIISLANILRGHGILNDADTSAIYESMSLPLGLPQYADNSAIQALQLTLDQLFSVIVAPK